MSGSNEPATGAQAGPVERLVTRLLVELAEYHPIAHPGMWELTVDRIRAAKVVMETERYFAMKDRVQGG